MKKRIFSLALVLALALSFAVPAGASSEEGGLRIIAPEDWELGVGQSRTLDYVFPATSRRVCSNGSRATRTSPW